MFCGVYSLRNIGQECPKEYGMPIQDHFGRFAMRLETMSQEQKWIDVDSIGEGLGLSSHDSRQLADMLSE